eukprot:GHUV01018232.1.p1 GENE.GHUV01018232.1~~GHUV01018232.1.p1  ORF type:complete len:298 (+),score=77.12 GHUV01018232.1:530-1423(+)
MECSDTCRTAKCIDHACSLCCRCTSCNRREEAHVLFARLLSGYGRDASLNIQERKAPGTVSITQLPGSPSASHPAASAFGSEAMDDDGPGTPYSRRSDKSSSEPGDVELTDLSMNSSAAYGYGSDRVRRRTKGDSGLSRCSSGRNGSVSAASQFSHAASHAAEAAVGWLSNAAAAAQAALPTTGLAAACLPSGAVGRHSSHTTTYSDQGSSSSGWQNISSAIAQGSSTLVQKIKRAASQPALAGDSAAGFAEAADAVLQSSLRVPSSTSKAGYNSIHLLARGTGLGIPPPRKDTKGD